MSTYIVKAVFTVFLILELTAQYAGAHGVHAWFVLSEKNAVMQDTVTLFQHPLRRDFIIGQDAARPVVLVADSGAATDDAGAVTSSDAADSGAATTTRPDITSSDAVENQLRLDNELKPSLFGKNLLAAFDRWKDSVYDTTGFQIGGDYNAIYFIATDSPGEDQSGSGVLRLYGKWDLIGRGTEDTGGIIYKIEQRHAYTDVAPADFSFELGDVGLLQSVFSDQGFRTTNLYWRQSLLDSNVVSYLGFLDVTDYVDVYLLASPWTNFSNLAFATGSGTIGGLPDGALGAMVAVWLTDSLYAIGGLADANADQTDVFAGFDTFFNHFETFKSLGLVWTTEKGKLFLNNIQLTAWQIDEREEAGTSAGWGISFSGTTTLNDRWMPFLRGGWADDGGSLLEASVSTGFGYQREPGGDVFGVGLNWGRPNADTFAAGLDDQFTSEVYYRWQLSQHLQLTPSIQLLGKPALNPDDDVIAVFGLRGRLVF